MPCRVKHPQMSQGVTSHRGMHCRALPGEGVFLSKKAIGSIDIVVHYHSVIPCLPSGVDGLSYFLTEILCRKIRP